MSLSWFRLAFVFVLALAGCGSLMSKPAQCSDAKQDGSETDTDCGGGICAACAIGKQCNTGSDCDSGACVSHRCDALPAQCSNGTKDGNETDVDCGGGELPRLRQRQGVPHRQRLRQQRLHQPRVRDSARACSDGMKNGSETDVDCGGDACRDVRRRQELPIGERLRRGDLRQRPVRHAARACTDGAKDGDETDVDCGGGTCAPVRRRQGLRGRHATAPAAAARNHVCAAPPAQCIDGVKNGSETDVDCGGGGCAACANGKACAARHRLPERRLCQRRAAPAPPAQCTDGVKDGSETDVDCGGGRCPACADGKACTAGADCPSGTCASGKCASPSAQCIDGVKDGSETDVDCGGGTCPACVNGKSCGVNSDCSSNNCDATTHQCAAQGMGSCSVVCTAATCGCTATCNGHTYSTSCDALEGFCSCVVDGQTKQSVSFTGGSCSDLSGLFSKYSAGGCGFAGTQG